MTKHIGPDYGDISEDQTPEEIAEQIEAADERHRQLPPPLDEQLEAIAERITVLENKARELVENHPPEPVNQRTLDFASRTDRYIIVRPDGEPYGHIPGIRWQQTRFSQRPAAIKHAKWLPAARVWDLRKNEFVPLGD